MIRFEMPFNVWCTGCGHLIGKGVRFNAEKKQVGMYHTTRVWSFSMRAPCCQQRIEVHTDPKNAEYQLVTGARRCLGVRKGVRKGVHGDVSMVTRGILEWACSLRGFQAE